jgi:predicted lipoprotein with Yx(FWY)xxD motif
VAAAPHAGRAARGERPQAVAAPLGKNSDGVTQVAYNRHPLYTDAGAKGFGLVGDRKPDDVKGQKFAGSWYVVSPSGKLIRR